MTALFVKKVLNWWRILNAKLEYKDIRYKDELQSAIGDKNDLRVDLFL